MRTLASFALTVGVAALFAGCAGSQSTIGALGSSPQRSTYPGSSSGNYRIVYYFGKAHGGDGNTPAAVLRYVNGTLFGTTTQGGSYSCKGGSYYFFGCGTVFGVTTGGTETMLHAFTRSDGADPESGVIEVKGTLYGTTYAGGQKHLDIRRSWGVVFGMTTAGSETVLRRFHSVRRAPEHPEAGLLNMDGVFYGTTLDSGNQKRGEPGFGTVFSITRSGAFHILYRFKGGSDGANPGSLIDVNHVLYGTTHKGGTNNLGTVFRITTDGVEHVIYSFLGGADGNNPNDGLLNLNGTLYGTTAELYYKYYCGSDCGTIYSITTSGSKKTLYTFTEGAGGANPNGNLVDVNGVLYGTASFGGVYNSGTVFSVTLGGTESVLHSFSGFCCVDSFSSDADGATPRAGLIAVKNTLYGTTASGGSVACGYRTGTYPDGCGTIFALKLSKEYR